MNYSKKTLENGLRVILVPMKDAATVTALVMVEAGSKYETKDVNGISHFLEHMCFKGTTRRPRTMDITTELDSIGAEYNAFTDLEYTGYYAKSHPKHLPKILDVLSDIYLNPVLDAAEIEREKGVIVEEINMYEDSPSELVDDVFEGLLYGDQPAGRPVIGTKETVRSFTRDMIAAYRAKHYVAQATTIVVSGGFEARAALSLVKGSFSGMPVAKKHGKPKVKDGQKSPAATQRRKDAEQTNIALGVRAFPASDERNFALRVLNAVLGGGMSSRLWQKVRNDMGAAYFVYPNPVSYSDHGHFGVYAGVDSGRVEEVVAAVMDELRRLRTEPVSERELKKAKDYLFGRINLRLETSDELAVFYGLQEVARERILKPAELTAKIRAVTAEQVRAVAKAIFRNDRLNFALVGRERDLGRIRELLAF